jgi:hypothetical protein
MVVGPVAHEITARIAEIGIFWEPWHPRKVESVGDRKPEEIAVERQAIGQLRDIEPEMAEPTNFERSRHQDPGDVVMPGSG